MTLTSGTRFGSYEVAALIGVGGMGEVYRARDTKLGREVALKLVSPMFAGDAERSARFEREAKLLASLSHSSIAAIYGLEEQAGQRAIAMELVEGRELAGPLPLQEALQAARQIAEGLEFAHERGVIHRDLKPANLRVTADGAVKILDFGLAKALTAGLEPATDTQVAVSPALSIAATQAGVLLGTAAYMAPEQAKGRTVDRRADIWSFGVVLYELLTGKRLFEGETVTETLAAVLKEPIDLAVLPKETPRAIRALLGRCLERDPRRRLQSIGEARIVIEDVLAGRVREEPAAIVSPGRARSGGAWVVAAAAVLTAAGAIGWASWVERGAGQASRSRVVTHFALGLPDGVRLASNRTGGPNMALSPDGRFVAFVAGEVGQQPTLRVRALASLTARRLEGTEEAFFPFWSPDSQHIAYFAGGRLMRIALAGGAPRTVAAAPDGSGGSWYRTAAGDEAILFTPDSRAAPVYRVPAVGGTATPVTELSADELRHAFPQVLPDDLLLYTAVGLDNRTFVQALGATERTLVLEGPGRVVYSDQGYLLYVREGSLLAQRFDLQRLRVSGDETMVADAVSTGGGATSAFSVGENSVVYRRFLSSALGRVRWYARDGTRGDIVLEAGDYSHLELSPDGRRLAVAVGVGNGTRDLWLKELATSAFQRLTALPGNETQEAWSPDSRRLAFSSAGSIVYSELGSGLVSPVPGGESIGVLHSWTPDGKYLLVGDADSTLLLGAPGAESDPAGVPQPVFQGSYSVDHFRVSPDARWAAYTSLESGRAEVMVAEFPGFTNRRQISLNGGTQPQWRADNAELFFHGLDERLMAVDIRSGEVLEVGAPRALFETNPLVNSTVVFLYAATPDGQRFLLLEPVEADVSAADTLYVLTNWSALLGEQ